jgi:hypothetical protein
LGKAAFVTAFMGFSWSSLGYRLDCSSMAMFGRVGDGI